VTVLAAPVQAGGQQPGAPDGSTTNSSGRLSGAPVNGIELSAPLSVQDTAPATGTRQVPTGRAHGTMHFANTTSLSKAVPAGTQFNAPNGVIVETTQSATVPPTDLLAGTIGRRDIPIDANVDGPDGNLAAGQLTGVYADALQYTNSELTGGEMETVKVVTQADIDGLTSTLMTRIESEVAGAVNQQLQPGQQLITQTISLTNKQVVADHKAGDDGDGVKVMVTGVAMGYAYSENDMNGSITGAVENWVATSSAISADAGAQLVGNITHGAITLISADNATGQVIYSTSATAPVKFTLTAGMAARIRDLVKGQDVARALELIKQTYSGYLSVGAIQSKVVWFDTTRLPSDPAHIVVQLASNTPGTGNPSQPSQQPPAQNARPAQR